MNILDTLRIGWRAITAHKLRSSLTTLGVVIGIGSVVVFLILGGGFLADAVAEVDDDTEPELSVQTQTDPEAGFGWQLDTSPIYTAHDIERLESIDGVEYVAPDGWLSPAQLATDEQRLTGSFNARTTIPASLHDVDDGLSDDIFTSENEAVLNEEATEALELDGAVGENVRLTLEDGREETFTIAGVVDDGDDGWNSEPTVYLSATGPYGATVETPRGEQERAYAFLTIRAESTDALSEVQEQARTYMHDESDAATLKQDGYEIRVLTQEEQIERFEALIDDITFFVAAIAGISLLVGSIGIANIMIVSVTERTREIGIMKAVGASRRDVMGQFLAESLLLGAIGAVFGVIAGIGVGYLAVTLAGWPMTYPLPWIAVAVVIGIVVGVLSGLYPAWRAANVDPIEALRE